MRTQRLSLGAVAALLAAGASACAPATAITVDVYTEVPCADDAEVSLTLADSLPALAASAPSSTSDGCVAGAPGHVGSVVIAPEGDEDALVSFAVVTRDDAGDPDACLTTSALPAACIVARRQLHYAPHLDLPMRVDLRQACLGVDCPSSQTCVEGACLSAVVPATCPAGCTESALVPPAGGPPQLAAGGVPGVRLLATKTGFAAAWPSDEAGGKHAVRLQALGADAVPVGSVSRPMAEGAAPIQQILLGSDGTSFGLAVRATSASFLVAAADGAVLAGPTQVSGANGLAVHGLPWDGTHFGLVVSGPATGDVTFTFYDTHAAAASYNQGSGSGASPVAGWDGATYFAAVSVDSTSTCWFSYTPDTAAGPGLSQLPSDCAGAYIAPRAGGWHFVYQSASAPAKVFYAQIDTEGTMTAGPTQISPGDGQAYGSAQVVSTPSGAAVFFVAAGGRTAPLYRADVDAGAKLTTPAAAVPGVVVGSASYEVAALGATVAAAWYGRTESPGSAATGTYVTKLP